MQLVPDTLEQPDHDLKIESLAGVALSVTVAPFATCALHVPADPVEQEIPDPDASATDPFPDTYVLSV